MILCIDVGNCQIHIGIFKDDKLVIQFRHNSSDGMSSDQFGIFLKMILAEKNINFKHIKNISICSVVPSLEYSIRAACIKYFGIRPFFLKVGAKTGLKLKYNNPAEIGADRIATAIGAVKLYPNTNIIIVDMGTATTVCAITKNKEYLAGAILPGIKSSAKVLSTETAQLPFVEIIKPQLKLGRTTKENIQIGLFYGQKGAIKELIDFITKYAFNNENYLVILTGGFSELYKDDKIFNISIPKLNFIGLNELTKLNDK
ncbi:type III pantothenate kinase [Rickettsiales endosymbiont of Trichoplax sp. H2]|uniref:type III pantothenate kinase n=1 Tax=Rickettsiales endosymbiont of Trichoplax sp. H2 TaxID=2021221 RepID=UPI0012B3558D|nr:type III pantothenate kinase [Rickettsiales endosymbiont of Trichoplax sp. H2]MSO14565.1 Type III pantothenate kinase [Rickettsiales endosymbiont of Trichoplax sp. H2]